MEESHSKRESENLDVQLPPMKRPALQSQQSEFRKTFYKAVATASPLQCLHLKQA